jgi:hypothetical protein
VGTGRALWRNMALGRMMFWSCVKGGRRALLLRERIVMGGMGEFRVRGFGVTNNWVDLGLEDRVGNKFRML